MGISSRARGLRLGRAWLPALLVACSDTSPSGSLVLGIHTNDLLIAEDVNLIGLYVDHLDAQGRSVERMAYEVAPLRTGDTVHVPLPSTLVLASSGVQGEKVHARLVAYRKETREVLTMREAKALVPTDRAQLLRLNLFFTNQNNVVDATPGVPVLASDLTLQDQQGPISADAFARFSSRCDGRAAGPEETADDGGRCVPLEVTLGEADRYDEEKGLRGTHPEDGCYDVAKTFAKRTDDAVRRIDRTQLPQTGACTIQLPGTFDVARLNVAMLTTEPAFDTPDWDGATLRPLAAGVAFAPAPHTITLTAAQCDVVRRSPVQGLLVSQRTTAWAGADPVCAIWNAAKAEGTFEGPPPGPPAPTDAGADADGQAESDNVANRSLGPIAVDGAGSLTLAADGSQAALAHESSGSVFVATFRYDDETPLAPATLSGLGGAHLWGVKFQDNLHYYVHARAQGVVKHVVTDGNGVAKGEDSVQVPAADGGTEEALGILAVSVDGNLVRTESGLHRMTDPTHATAATVGSLPDFSFTSAWPAVAFSSGAGSGLIVDTNFGSVFAVDPVGIPLTFSPSNPVGDELVGVGTQFFGTMDVGGANKLAHYFVDTAVQQQLALESLDGFERLAGTEGHLCYTRVVGSVRQLQCSTSDVVGVLGTPTAPLPGAFHDVAIAADPLYLHAVYACAAGSEYRAVKIPWALVDTPDPTHPKLQGCPAATP